ncbi:MAG: hypothetical protein OEM49_06320 [Myxococcales bacterium]|nr:hypothetical protein [Myxococcales bacterium]MDH5307727.1 hypothetical protein [Myxococcales bacterium]MDH5567947.1 hypothetical protein [Myxococcales bacterium]
MANRPKLGELLVAAGAIDKVQLGAALADQRQFGRPLGTILVQMGYLDEETLVRTLARQLKIPVAWLRGKWVEPEVIELVPAEIVLKHHCLPLSVVLSDKGKMLYLAMQDPGDLEAIDAVRFQVGHPISPVLAAASELEEAIQRHYPSGKGRHAGGAAAAQRPELLQPPELLSFEVKESVAENDAEPTFELGTELGEATTTLSAAEASLGAVTQLLTVLLDRGVVRKEELTNRLCHFLSKLADDSR